MVPSLPLTIWSAQCRDQAMDLVSDGIGLASEGSPFSRTSGISLAENPAFGEFGSMKLPYCR